jgi:hypothetical protein
VRVETRDLRHAEAAWVALEFDDRIAGSDIAFLDDGEVEAEQSALEELRGGKARTLPRGRDYYLLTRNESREPGQLSGLIHDRHEQRSDRYARGRSTMKCQIRRIQLIGSPPDARRGHR